MTAEVTALDRAAAEARVQVELFEQSVRGDLMPCVPPDRLDLAVERVTTNPHLRQLVALFSNAQAASAKLADILAETIDKAAVVEVERDRLAAQVKRVRAWAEGICRLQPHVSAEHLLASDLLDRLQSDDVEVAPDGARKRREQ